MPGACTCPGGRPPCIPSGIGLPHGAACWPAAAGSRTACHPSFHTCPSSHTVGSGPNTGRKVRGVPGVPPVAKEAPFSSARHDSRSGPTDRARAARSRAAPRPASANAARAPPPCSPWPRRAAAASQPRRRRSCSSSELAVAASICSADSAELHAAAFLSQLFRRQGISGISGSINEWQSLNLRVGPLNQADVFF